MRSLVIGPRSRQLFCLLAVASLALTGCSDSSSKGGGLGEDSDASSSPDGSTGHDAGTQHDAGTAENSPVGSEDSVSYLGGVGHEKLNAVHRLSDGTFLLGGASDNTDWIPAGTETIELGTGGMNSSADGQVAFLAHVSADLTEVLRVVHFPQGTAADVFRIRSTEVPGTATGDIYISGNREVGDTSQMGYYIAKLDGNFVDAVPTDVAWSRDIVCEPRRASGFKGVSAFQEIQPWDVGSDGKVVYGRGAEYDFDWADIRRLTADGEPDVVNHWPAHWHADGEFYGPADTFDGTINESAVVLKAGRMGSLRSKTQEDYELVADDGNGETRQGAFPDDYYFSGPCVPGDCPGGPGYTGYRTSDKPTQRLGGIAIDRRTGDIYFGYSTQSKLPGGNPDFEPALVAMEADGELKWWSRLYTETDQNSSPDQYVDGVAIDYAGDKVVVLARAHGNNTYNLWNGADIAANPDFTGFQRQFTGTNGNIHISWLGKLALADGTLTNATYVAELNEGAREDAPTFGADKPHLEGQPNPNAGWQDLNTTRCNRVRVDLDGRVYVSCRGRRTITTNDAFQKMPGVGEGIGQWNRFVRAYNADLSDIVYSTLVTGEWDWETGEGGGVTEITDVWGTPNGVLAVGHHPVYSDKDEEEGRGTAGEPRGEAMPTTNALSWTHEGAPQGMDGILGYFYDER
jgi:hypothetical protein